MANGNQGKVNISIPFDTESVVQSLMGGMQQPQGQGMLLAQNQPREDQLTPVVSDVQTNVAQAAPQLAEQKMNEPPPQVAASANLPDPSVVRRQVQTTSAFDVMASPERARMAQRLNELMVQQQEQRQAQIGSLQEALARAEQSSPGTAQAVGKSLANFADAFYGSNISKNVRGPETPQEREARLNKLRLAISKEQSSLTKDQINALKASLEATGNTRLAQALGRQERFQQSFEFRKTLDRRRRKEKIFDRVEKMGLFDLAETFEGIDKVVPGGVNNFDSKKDNLPGIGGAEALVPLARLTDPRARELRQLALGLGNQILKARSGAQINEQEAVRILGELGIDQAVGEGGGTIAVFRGARSDDEFINGVRRAIKAVERRTDTLRDSFGKDAFDEVAPGFKVNLTPKGKGKKQLTNADIDKMSAEELRAAGLID